MVETQLCLCRCALQLSRAFTLVKKTHSGQAQSYEFTLSARLVRCVLALVGSLAPAGAEGSSNSSNYAGSSGCASHPRPRDVALVEALLHHYVIVDLCGAVQRLMPPHVGPRAADCACCKPSAHAWARLVPFPPRQAQQHTAGEQQQASTSNSSQAGVSRATSGPAAPAVRKAQHVTVSHAITVFGRAKVAVLAQLSAWMERAACVAASPDQTPSGSSSAHAPAAVVSTSLLDQLSRQLVWGCSSTWPAFPGPFRTQSSSGSAQALPLHGLHAFNALWARSFTGPTLLLPSVLQGWFVHGSSVLEAPGSWNELLPVIAAVASTTQSSGLRMLHNQAVHDRDDFQNWCVAMKTAQLDVVRLLLEYITHLNTPTAVEVAGSPAPSSAPVIQGTPLPASQLASASEAAAVSNVPAAAASGPTNAAASEPPSAASGNTPASGDLDIKAQPMVPSAAGNGAPPFSGRAHAWALAARCLRTVQWLQQAAPQLAFSDRFPDPEIATYACRILTSSGARQAWQELLRLHGTCEAAGTLAPSSTGASVPPAPGSSSAPTQADLQAQTHAVLAAMDVCVFTAGRSFTTHVAQGEHVINRRMMSKRIKMMDSLCRIVLTHAFNSSYTGRRF